MKRLNKIKYTNANNLPAYLISAIGKLPEEEQELAISLLKKWAFFL